MTFTARQFKNLRELCDCTKPQWAVVIGVTRRGVDKWECGENDIPAPMVALCVALGMMPARLRNEFVKLRLGN